MRSKPKANDVFGEVNLSLMARRFRELADEELAKAARAALGETSAANVAKVGIAAGRSSGFRSAAEVIDVIEDGYLKKGAAA